MILKSQYFPRTSPFLGVIALAALIFSISNSRGQSPSSVRPSFSPIYHEIELPSPRREFRAAWVATIHNLDWPSRPGLLEYELKQEVSTILDRLEELKMNAVILQVRPHGDALYPSALEPWTTYLSGRQGQAPPNNFDPLKYWIEQSHLRGIELHAWFNPFRAYHHSGYGEMSPKFVVKSKPHLTVKLKKDDYWWMNPALPESREHSIKVVMDVVSRYDIDGVHFDDYFYPYPSFNNNVEFPDWDTYQKYQSNGGNLSIDDWRRDAVNQLIAQLSREIKQRKPHVNFGISPFGIWRPGYPEGVDNFNAYKSLYADSKRWLKEGWVDYLMPQLYWPVEDGAQSFPILLEWWHGENHMGRHIWPGIKLAKKPQETIDKIEAVRRQKGSDSGMAVFSAKGLLGNNNPTAQRLKKEIWTEKAVIPRSPWLRDGPPPAPEIRFQRNTETGQIELLFFPKNQNDTFQFVINEKQGGQWRDAKVFPTGYRSHTVDENQTSVVAIRVVNRKSMIGVPAIVNLAARN